MTPLPERLKHQRYRPHWHRGGLSGAVAGREWGTICPPAELAGLWPGRHGKRTLLSLEGLLPDLNTTTRSSLSTCHLCFGTMWLFRPRFALAGQEGCDGWWCGQPHDRAGGAVVVHDRGRYRARQDMNKEQRQAEESPLPKTLPKVAEALPRSSVVQQTF